MNAEDAPRRNRLLEWVIEVSSSRPRLVIAAWVALSLVAVPGILRLRFDSSTESVLDRSGAEWQTYLESTRLFGNDEDLVVALPADQPFQASVLEDVARLSARLQGASGVQRVDSIATTPSIRLDADGELSLRPLLDVTLLGTEDGFTELVRRIQEDESVQGLLVAMDGRTFGIRLRVEEAGSAGYAPLLDDVRRSLAGTNAWLSGVPIFREETGSRTRAEVGFFVPLTLAAICTVLLVVFRSLAAIGIAIGVSGASTAIVLGVMGTLDVPLTLTTAILPPVLLAIGCASTTHLLCETSVRCEDEAVTAAQEVSPAILLSGVITSLAFLSGTVVPIEAIRFVGVFGAMGALVVAVCAVSLGTALIVVAPVSRNQTVLSWLHERGGASTVSLVARHPTGILVAWAVALAACGWGLARVKLDTDVTNWFPRGGQVRESYEEIRGRLAGISPINVMISAPQGGSVADAELVTTLEDFTRFLEGLQGVDKAVSMADPLRRLHRALQPDGTGTTDRISSPLVEQYLLLLEATEEIGELVADDRSVANVAVRANDNGSEELLRIAELADEWWREHGVAGFAAQPTGIMFEFARAEHAIAVGQIAGVAVDIGTLATLYLLVFRSATLASIALVPSIVTVVIAFGLLGVIGAPLDAGTVFVGMLAIGVTVDETIHLVSAFSRELVAGRDPRDAMRRALERVFPALAITTIALACGFAVLGLSSFSFTQRLGSLTATAVVVCAAASSSLLPTLLGRYKVVGRRIK